MSFTTVTVTGKYLTAAGTPEVGHVSFALSAPIMDAAGKVVRSAATVTVTLDGTGAFSVALPANDDTGTTPTGTSYEVLEQLSQTVRAYSVVVPHAAVAGTVDITALAPVVNGSIVYGVASLNGRTGTVSLSKADVTGTGLAAADVGADAAGAATAAQAAAIAASKGLPLALTGATQPTRYVGRWATSGAPASGTFAVGDFGFDGVNTVQLCTVAGSPGTWVAGGSAAYAPLVDAALTGSPTVGGNPIATVNEGPLSLLDPRIGASNAYGSDTGPKLDTAIGMLPTNGGEIYAPAGRYRFTTAPSAITHAAVKISGGGGMGFSESDAQAAGTAFIADAGVNLLQFGATGASSVEHRGPIIDNIHFREVSAGVASVLLRFNAINRFTVRNCSFKGGAQAIYIDPVTPASLDASWGLIEQPVIKGSTYGIYAPQGGDFVVQAGDVEAVTAGVYVRPAGSLTGQFRMFGTKVDNCAVGIDTQGADMLAFGVALENCTVGLQVGRNSGLHSRSGNNNRFYGAITGTGTETGVSFPSAAAALGTILEWDAVNLATALSGVTNDTTLVDRRLGGTFAMSRATSGIFQLFRNGGTDLAQFLTSGSTSFMAQLLAASATFNVKLGDAGGSSGFNVQDSGGGNVFRAYSDGFVGISKSGGSVGFFGASAITKPQVTGSRSANAALASLITQLANYGLVTDSTTV